MKIIFNKFYVNVFLICLQQCFFATSKFFTLKLINLFEKNLKFFETNFYFTNNVCFKKYIYTGRFFIKLELYWNLAKIISIYLRL